MRYYKYIFFSFLSLLVSAQVLSNPENYDPMDEYKKKVVQERGPSQKKITSTLTGKVIAHAKYEYNPQKQLIKSSYYKNGKPDGTAVFTYNKNGLDKENIYDTDGNLLDTIRYTVNKSGNIVSYEVLNKGLVWKFRYTRSRLKVGTRYMKGKKTESFVMNYTKPTLVVKKLYSTSTQKKVGTITFTYKKAQIHERSRDDNLGKRKSLHNYDNKDRLKEVLLFSSSQQGGSKLYKKHLFIY